MGQIVINPDRCEARILALERKVADLEQIVAVAFHLLAGDAVDTENEFILTLHETAYHRDRSKDLRPDEHTAHLVVANRLAELR